VRINDSNDSRHCRDNDKAAEDFGPPVVEYTKCRLVGIGGAIRQVSVLLGAGLEVVQLDIAMA
jgi:hypothetical protein